MAANLERATGPQRRRALERSHLLLLGHRSAWKKVRVTAWKKAVKMVAKTPLAAMFLQAEAPKVEDLGRSKEGKKELNLADCWAANSVGCWAARKAAVNLASLHPLVPWALEFLDPE